MYKIIDKQVKGNTWGGDKLFKTKEDVRLHLIEFHSIDCNWIEDFSKEKLEKFTLQEILDWGEWKIEEVK